MYMPKNHRYLVLSMLGIASLMATAASSAPRSTREADAGSDVSVSITANRSTVRAGQRVTYTVTMTNLGPQDATFVDVAMDVPASLRVVSLTCDLGISADGPFCEYSSLPAGSSVVSELVVTPQGDSTIRTRTVTTSASILYENADTLDPNPGNNSASAKTKIVGRLPRP